MRYAMKLLFGGLLFVSVITIAASALMVPQDQSSQSAKTPPARQPASARGDVVFQQNCARYHNSPQGFSSRISGTVSRHMRVRANLSDADYQELMRFLNP
jgi:hypothetical protein